MADTDQYTADEVRPIKRSSNSESKTKEEEIIITEKTNNDDNNEQNNYNEPKIRIVITSEDHTHDEILPINKESSSSSNGDKIGPSDGDDEYVEINTNPPSQNEEDENENAINKSANTNENENENEISNENANETTNAVETDIEPSNPKINVVFAEKEEDASASQSNSNEQSHQTEADTQPIALPPPPDEDEQDDTNKDNDIDDISLNMDDLGDFQMIDRAHTDPLALQSKTSSHPNDSHRNSIRGNDDIGEEEEEKKNAAADYGHIKGESVFTKHKRYHSHDDIMDDNINKLGDFPGFSIREISKEVLLYKTEHGKHDKEEEIVVPARNNLVKMPFYSTPLTIESTNNAFFDFKERLIEMGFIEQAEAALVHTKCESVEAAVSFILMNFDAIYHRFERAENGNFTKNLASINEINQLDDDGNIKANNCSHCAQPYDQHLIDENGAKIQIGMNENNYNHDEDYQIGIYDIGDYDIGDYDIDEEFMPDDSVKIEVFSNDRMIKMDMNSLREVIQKAESDLEPQPVYDGPTQECLICFDAKPVDYFTKTECGHDHYCKECLTQHYKVKTKDGMFDTLCFSISDSLYFYKLHNKIFDI